MSSEQDLEDRFIELVHQNRCLYDTKHFQYRDVLLKQKTWGRIAKEFKMDTMSAKKKWRHLRDGYQRYKKSHKNRGYSKSTVLSRYARLTFLDKVFCPRKSWETTTYQGNQELSDDAGDEDTADDDDYERPSPATATVKQELDVNFEPVEYTYNNCERENVFVMQHDPIKSDAPHSNKTLTEKKDDVEFFCLHVAEVLRNLPPVEKANAKKQLNDVLFEYELMAAKSSRDMPSTSTG